MDRFICEEATTWRNPRFFFSILQQQFSLIHSRYILISQFSTALTHTHTHTFPFRSLQAHTHNHKNIYRYTNTLALILFYRFDLFLHANLWIMLWGCNCDRTNWISGEAVWCVRAANSKQKKVEEDEKSRINIYECLCAWKRFMDLFWKKKNEIIKKNSLGPNVPLPLFTSLASFSFTLMVVCSLFISVSLCLYRRRRLVLASMSRSSVCEREWHWRNHTFDSEHKHTHTHTIYMWNSWIVCAV